ncbi:MAG: amino acid adenylation domain-containing protein [Legionellaceae bacterium]|nr:amino acid adenylation domain-containing protein [Legionellaceae bacterium]
MSKSDPNYNRQAVEIFEEQVVQYPTAVALQDQHISYTYAEMNKIVNQFARCLQKKSVGAGDLVAILLEPSADYILSILAILKVGAAYVPLDTLAPKSRLQDILDDASPKLVIYLNDNFSQLKKITNNTLTIKQLHMESLSYPVDNLNISISPASPIYMMYTSGSTGKPKGVIVPHRAVVNLVVTINYAAIKKYSRIAQFSSLAFDGSSFEIWSALLNRANLSIIPENIRTNHNELKHYLQVIKVDCLFLPSGYFHQLLKSSPDTLDGVKTIVFGGEQVNHLLIKQFLEYRRLQKCSVILINGYGPTEATVFTCRHIINENSFLSDNQIMSIGSAIQNVQTYVLDASMHEVSEGELYISGANLALGYHNASPDHDDKFLKNPFRNDEPYNLIYRTGDKVRRLPTGELLCLGRLDDQVKVGGFRVHLSEIEQNLMQHEAISLAAVNVELGGGMHKLLTAYLIFTSTDTILKAEEIREFLAQSLPPYMLPSKYVMIDKFPLTSVGKVDKRSLDKMAHTDLSFHVDTSSESDIEEAIKKTWKHLLNHKSIETHKNLFELGANSLLITEACARINQTLHTDLLISDILTHPTIHKLSRFIEGDVDAPIIRKRHAVIASDIAIVGMSCRTPKANTLEEFWNVLCQGIDGLTRFDDDDELVPVRGILDGVEQFDASFFGFSPADASITDPAHRLFLECAWEALENAGVAPSKLPTNVISVFSGMTDSSYLHENLLKSCWFCQEQDAIQQRIATSTSMLSTQTSYRLNLKGKSVNINTACSTGLMVVEQACQDLLLGRSDIALAGASSIVLPQERGYRYQPGSIVSPDGFCRPFAENANGTVFSNGVGVIALKRLEDAIQDNDTIYAVIKGCGVNNDGADKLGFTAPSVHGQMTCIRDALNEAELTPEDISYVEAHGTATSLGDVIEVKALSSVYREKTDKKNYCALGSVKANIGHTDAAAGIIGLIKTVLCLYHKQIPPLLHFKSPNPDLALESSPFYVNTTLQDWEHNEPRYAGVSSFGVGGTNVHVVLGEYAPKQSADDDKKPREELLLLSAKSEPALLARQQQSRDILTKNPLSDVAYTLQAGREDFSWRSYTVIDTPNLTKQIPTVFVDEDITLSIVFLFSGQGTQYPGMALDLMEKVPRFKTYIEKGVSIAKSYLNIDLLSLLKNGDHEQWMRTEYAQPTLFIIEYAIAKLLIDCKIQPSALMGHSLGEYVAACVAGVFSFEDGVALVCERGLLMAHAEPGAMLALECSIDACVDYQKKFKLELALHNATNHWVLAGAPKNVAKLAKYLENNKQPFQSLKVQNAFHSRLMEPLERAFKSMFTNVALSPPTIPIVSNVTGSWLSETDAMCADYWYRHLRHTVKFSEGIGCILHDKHPMFVEIGPGQSLCGFVKATAKKPVHVTNTLPNRHQSTTDLTQLLTACGEIWAKGIPINLETLRENLPKQLIPLPTYPFQRQRYWVDADKESVLQSNKPQLYKPVWSRQKAYIKNVVLSKELLSQHTWIVFIDKLNLGNQFIDLLEKHQISPIVVKFNVKYKQEKNNFFQINPAKKEHYNLFIQSIQHKIKTPIILHLASYANSSKVLPSDTEINAQLDRGFYSLLYLSQAYLSETGDQNPLKVAVITSETQSPLGSEATNPLNTTLIGPCRIIMQEHPNIRFRLIDLNCTEEPQTNINLLQHILHICVDKPWQEIDYHVSYRQGYQWNVAYIPLPEISNKLNRLKDNGIYILTGGLGGIALTCAEAIARAISKPTFILLSRSQVPTISEWSAILKNSAHQFHNKLKKIKKLKELGATCLFFKVDITKYTEIESVTKQCITSLGAINGLIHTAGISQPELAQFISKETAQHVLAPKVYGTYNLIKIFNQIPLDFVVLTSSLAVLLGGLRQVDYCAANACLDAFADGGLFTSADCTISINWNTWRDVGIAAMAAKKGESHFIGQGNDISSKEGKSLFLDVIQSCESRVAVSNHDLQKQTPLKLPSSPIIKISRQQVNVGTTYAKPMNKVESHLAQLWQDSLGIDEVGVNDDFFTLGGHSLKALSLIEKINEAFNCQISVTHLYRTPTIKELSKTISYGAKTREANIVVKLKQIEDKPPYLFLCHPISGLVYCFNTLVSNSGLPLSIYGLQDPSIEMNKMLYKSLSDMAKEYLLAIQTIQPNGPYFLMGYSFGGSLMYEVAHILQQQGQQISMLAMIDSWAINTQDSSEYHFKQQFLNLDKTLSKSLIELSWKREQLLLQHKPTVMQQDMILFKASQLLDDYQDIDHPTNGWSNYNTGKIMCHHINGNHDTILNEENSKNILYLIKKIIF